MKYLTLIFLIFQPAFSLANSGGEPQIAIRKKVEVSSGEKVTLYKVSTTKNLSPALIGQLKAIKLSRTPKAGEKIVLMSADLSKAIRQNFDSQTRTKIKLSIPNQVVVENLGQGVNKKNVERRLISHWKGLCAECTFEIHRLTLPAISEEASGQDWQLELGHTLTRGNFSLRLTLGESSKVLWVTGHVKILKQVPVAVRILNLGERINPKDFVYQTRDVTFSHDSTLGSEQMKDLNLRRTISAGDIIWQSALQKEKALSRGDFVKVKTGTESFQISTTARAEQDGFIGDYIRVKNLKTNKTMTGVVTAKGEVEIQ